MVGVGVSVAEKFWRVTKTSAEFFCGEHGKKLHRRRVKKFLAGAFGDKNSGRALFLFIGG